MQLDPECIEIIRQIVREEIQKALKSEEGSIISPAPLDSVHQVQQQALQLLKEGKREESIALLKAYSKRESAARREAKKKAALKN